MNKIYSEKNISTYHNTNSKINYLNSYQKHTKNKIYKYS